jgi:hypothetical protein
MGPNCCTNLNEVIIWFKKLKDQGVKTKQDCLDSLEFDSDQYPDMNVLNKAASVVFGE